jgi:hypothetical protein
MPAWAKIVLRSVGTLDAVLAVLGFYWLVFFVHNVLARARPDPYAPYFGISFAVMTAINIAFLALFLHCSLSTFQAEEFRHHVLVQPDRFAQLIRHSFCNQAFALTTSKNRAVPRPYTTGRNTARN